MKDVKDLSAQIVLTEYQSLQNEIAERSKTLHQLNNLAIILIFIALVLLVIFKSLSISQVMIQWYLLSLPPIFAFLSFNYQANGLTLEIILQYTQTLLERNFKELGPSSWRSFYIEHKARQRLIAFAKVLPLLAPQLIPIVMIIFNQIDFVSLAVVFLFAIDIGLLIFTALNFRYKLSYLR